MKYVVFMSNVEIEKLLISCMAVDKDSTVYKAWINITNSCKYAENNEKHRRKRAVTNTALRYQLFRIGIE